MKGKYDDIINLTRPPSKRAKMDNVDRAAQFSPFAALTGHDTAVKETARITQEKLEIDQGLKEEISRKLLLLEERIKDKPQVLIEYFQEDENKGGGEYIRKRLSLKKIDSFRKKVITLEGKEIYFDDIYQIDFKGDIL